ncbi:uncharacterized protein MEPE_00497 [Melanopsichium pennsylvanicum]|uniref:Zn(2)-C6 fungal-type domain-containing protein n=2 Tax=Melanopsichium pennsylvanicum TaxID=63383 RepID=A0AAJ4XGR1_9BASI
MDLIRPVEDKVKAARSGSRLQNRACDQCRRSKRRCDLAEAGFDGLPIQHAGPCKLCVRKNLQCTTHWSALQQTVSSSRQELRHISQTSASYTALQDQLSSHQYLPAGLSTSSKSLSDTIDGLFISTRQLFTYVAAWEWIWQHFLGPSATPIGVGLVAGVHSQRGLLCSSAARAWDSMMVVSNVAHVSPSFFYSTFVCDEAYRPAGRFKRLSKKADEISMQALQYAIVAYASQYGSQSPGEWRDDERDKLRRRKDTDVAEAAWMRARDFLMANSSVTTFRMAYALHLFSNTCPPLRTAKTNIDVVSDAIFTLQTGLRMMDDLATELLRQQDEDLFAIGYHNEDGEKIGDGINMRSDRIYRTRIERAHALKDVAESLLWYSAVCDAATTSGFGMPPIVRSSTLDKVDIDALQLTAAMPAASISAPGHVSVNQASISTASTHFGSIPDSVAPFAQNSFSSMHDISPDSNTHHVSFGDPTMLRLEPGLMMQAAAVNGEFGSSNREWSHRSDPIEAEAHCASSNVSAGQGMSSALSASSGAGSEVFRSWSRIAHRAMQVSKKIPYIMSRLASAPGDPVQVKEFLNLLQTGASTQIMTWQRNGNFRACLDNPSITAAGLAEQFQRTWSMILFVEQNFQPLLDLDPQLYIQMPASAQSMATHVINQVCMGSLLFLELCSFLEGTPWLPGSRDPSWPRAAILLRVQLDRTRDLRHQVRRRSALRIGNWHREVDKQVERALRYGGSPPQINYHSEHSSPNGSGHSSQRGSDAGHSESSGAFSSGTHPPLHIDIPLPQDDMIVPALQIHSSRHPVPTHLASALHISFCALVPDALQEMSQHGAASPVTLDALDADLRGLQGILDSILSFGPFFHREPSLDTLFSTRNWLAPGRPPLVLSLR